MEVGPDGPTSHVRFEDDGIRDAARLGPVPVRLTGQR